MRPDRPDPAGVTWADYLAAMAAVDRAIVFNIASPPTGDPDPLSARLTGSVFEAPAREVNDNTAALRAGLSRQADRISVRASA